MDTNNHISKVISCWSPYHGQCGTTLNSALLSSYLAINSKYKILVTNTQYTKSNLETAFLKDNNKNYDVFNDIGIDSVYRLAQSNKLTKDNISNYSKVLIKDKLDLLVGSKKSTDKLFNEILSEMDYILECMKESYNLIMFDVNSGLENTMTKTVLDASDVIIVNLTQNIKLLRDFFENYLELFKEKNLILVLGNYDDKLSLTKRYTKKLFNCERNIYSISYMSELKEAHNNSNILKLINHNNIKLIDKDDKFYFLMNELDTICEDILTYAGINDKATDKISTKTVLNKVLNLF